MLYFVVLLTLCSDAKHPCKTVMHSYYSMEFECIRQAQRLNKRSKVHERCVSVLQLEADDEQN